MGSGLRRIADILDDASQREKEAAKKMVIDALTPEELASYIFSNWGVNAANKLANSLDKLTETPQE